MRRETDQPERLHRVDRLRYLASVAALAAVVPLLAAGCGGKKGPPAAADGAGGAPPAALAPMDMEAAASFCDKAWPGEGPGAVDWAPPALKAIPGTAEAPAAKPGWRWINFWATWCAPCLEEMPLLARWSGVMQAERAPVSLELWSVDEDQGKLVDWLRRNARTAAGPVRWVESTAALSGTLTRLGLNPDAALPIHVLVDTDGKLRCVRMGFVHANDYGTIRRIIGL